MREGYITHGLRWVLMTAVAALMASAVLGLIFPESFRILRVPERLAALGLFILLVWAWLAKATSSLDNQRHTWMNWAGLLGLTLLVAPGILWAIWTEDPEASLPPAWLNGLTFCGYPLVLAWAYHFLRATLASMRKVREMGWPWE